MDHFSTLELVLSVPVALCVQHLVKRLVLKPYPRNAWGFRLMVGFAVGAGLLLVQFVVAVIHYRKEIAASFYLGGIPIFLYALLMLAAVHKLFPPLKGKDSRGFLLLNFQKHSRYIYTCLLGISVISLFLGHYVFWDLIGSSQQAFRMLWITVFSIAIFIPSNRLGIHIALFAVAFIFLALLVILLPVWGWA